MRAYLGLVVTVGIQHHFFNYPLLVSELGVISRQIMNFLNLKFRLYAHVFILLMLVTQFVALIKLFVQ